MKRFKKVYLEITNICNLSCSFCPKTSRKLKMMEEKEFEVVLDTIRPFTDYIYLHLMGEPLLHPSLKLFLDLSYKKGFKVNITTNGTLLPKVQGILMASPALRQVNLSLHSFEANDSQVALEDYIRGITDFVKQAQAQTRIICGIRLWNMDTETIKAENALNNKIIKMLEEGLDLDINLLEAIKNVDGVKLKERVYLNKAEKFEWPDRNKEVISEEVFCYGLRDQLGILVDGTVVPCCLDSGGEISLGNVFEKSLEDILASERATNLYEGFSRRCAVEPLCKRCGYVTRYQK